MNKMVLDFIAFILNCITTLVFFFISLKLGKKEEKEKKTMTVTIIVAIKKIYNENEVSFVHLHDYILKDFNSSTFHVFLHMLPII